MSDETQTIKISIPEDTPPMRLDKALAILHPDLSRSRLKSLILSGDVIVSGYIVKTASYKVSSKDEIIISVPVAVEDTPRAQNIPLILFMKMMIYWLLIRQWEWLFTLGRVIMKIH
ncbi:MAG: S4 domain-containing protein [Alphaproteobacteria bacterium]